MRARKASRLLLIVVAEMVTLPLVVGALALRGPASSARAADGGPTVAATADGCVVIPGRTVQATDTTGAGDCFVGALAARLLAGEELEPAMDYANLAASICVQRTGAGTSLPSAEEVASQARR